MSLYYVGTMSGAYSNNTNNVTHTRYKDREIHRTSRDFNTYISRFLGLYALLKQSGSLVLDLGAGDSSFGKLANDMTDGGMKVISCDYGYSVSTPHNPGIMVAGDACHLPFQDESFDGVIMSWLLPWLPEERPEILLEVGRVLKTGGKAFVQPWGGQIEDDQVAHVPGVIYRDNGGGRVVLHKLDESLIHLA